MGQTLLLLFMRFKYNWVFCVYFPLNLATVPPADIWRCLGNIFGCLNWGTSSGSRPGMLLNIFNTGMHRNAPHNKN